MRLSFRENGKLSAMRLKEGFGGVNGSLDSSTDEFRCRKEQILDRQRQSFTTGYSKSLSRLLIDRLNGGRFR